MKRVLDPFVVRRVADCIELLPKLINSPLKMPVVQQVVRRALEELKSDREVASLGFESLAQGDDRRDGQQYIGKKYRLVLRDAEDYRKKAEDYRKPVTSVWLSDTDNEALKAGLEDDETGIFEFIERQAADIAEWVKEHRHPRDAELFRSHVAFVCGESLIDPVRGVEVSPGVYGLDLSQWETEVAKPLCDNIRIMADEMESKTGLNTEFVALSLLNRIISRDDSTVKRWKDRLSDSQKEKRGNRWFVNYHAFRRIALEGGVELPIDKDELTKRV